MSSIYSKKEKLEEEIKEDMKKKNEFIESFEKIKLELSKVDNKLENDYKNRSELDSIINNTQIAFEKV